jgi:hypothetical protein
VGGLAAKVELFQLRSSIVVDMSGVSLDLFRLEGCVGETRYVWSTQSNLLVGFYLEGLSVTNFGFHLDRGCF